MHARRLLGHAARLLEVAARERVFRAGHQLGEIGDERGPLALRRARVRQHDHAGALEPEQRFRHLEIRAPQLGCDGAHVADAVDHRQHFPLGRQQVELALARLLRRREHGHDAEVGDAPLDAGPFVDAPGALHQQRLGGDAHGGVRGQLGRGAFAEGEVAFAPAHHLEDDLFDLEADLALELARGERAERHQDLAEPAAVALALLHVARALEIGLADLTRPEQQRAQGVGVRADLGEDDGSEVTRNTPVFRLRSRSWKTSWMPSSRSGPSMGIGQAASEAKMCFKSSAVRACARAAWANGPAGSTRVTFSHACTASP